LLPSVFIGRCHAVEKLVRAEAFIPVSGAKPIQLVLDPSVACETARWDRVPAIEFLVEVHKMWGMLPRVSPPLVVCGEARGLFTSV
jgi:hypothetical protein